MQNNEIKEILDRLEKIGFYASVPKELAYMTTNITPQECKTILDYITNLQQKIKHYEETTTFGDYVKEVNLLVDYKSRIEKAVEYIKEHVRIDDEYPLYMYMLIDEKHELLNILNGRSDK